MFDKLLSSSVRQPGVDIAASIQPFPVGGSGHYFAGDADRVQRLNLLTHLLPSGGVLLVLGEAGVGKSALLRQLLLRASDSCRVCQLSASASIDPGQALREMLDCFAWQADVDRSLGGAQIRTLREHLGILRRNGYAPVLVIDDAEALPDTIFGLLEQVFDADNSDLLTLVLIGDVSLKQRLSMPLMQGLNSHVCHELELLPFSVEEQAGYIRQHMEAQGLEGMGPFQASSLKFIHAASRGMPQRINELARVFWTNQKSAADADEAGRSRWAALGLNLSWLRAPGLKQLRYILPVLALSSAAAIFHVEIRSALFSTPASSLLAVDKAVVGKRLVTTIAARSVWGVEQSSMPAAMPDAIPGREVAIAAEPERLSLAQANRPPVGLKAKVVVATRPPSDSVVAPLESGVESGADTAVPVPASVLASLAPIAAVEPAVEPEKTVPIIASAVPVGGELKPVKLAVQAVAQPQPSAVIAENEPKDELSSPAPAVVVVPQGGTLKQAAATPAQLASASSLASQPEPIVSALAPAETASVAASVASRVAGDIAAGQIAAEPEGGRLGGKLSSVKVAVVAEHADDWWLAQSAGQFAVQLLAMEEKVVKAYIQRHELSGKLATFSVHVGRDRQQLVAAALGPFPTQAEASAAARQWRLRLPDIKPWVRSVGSIQQAVTDFRRQQRPTWLALVAKHEQQLLQRPAQNYAVQLMAMDRAAVTQFVKKHDLVDQVIYFRTRSGGQELYAALLGSFPSRQQALDAGHDIAAKAVGVRPWVRSMASVQQVIRDQADRPR